MTNNNSPKGRGSKLVGYDAKILYAFVESQTTLESLHHSGRNGQMRWSSNGLVRYINKHRISSDDSRRMLRWRDDQPLVGLAVVDAFLMRYGLMTWELEEFAQEHHGWNGYVTPDSPAPVLAER